MSESAFKVPTVTMLCPCPNCARLLVPEHDFCPHCREPLDDEYKLLGTLATVVTTQAVSSAHTVETLDPAVYLFLTWTVTVWFTFMGWMLPFAALIALIPLSGIVGWYRRFGGLPIADPDYRKASREIRRSFVMWIAYVVVVVCLSILWWR